MVTSNPGFSRPFAKAHGVTEAILVRYLANRIRKSKTKREDKKWFYNPITKLAEQWPYFGRSTIADALKRLKKAGVIEVGRFNKFKQDRTQWYSASQEVLDAVEEDIIYFDAGVAADHGVCAGVIILNFVALLKSLPWAMLRFSATEYSRVVPFSVSAIRNALNSMITAKLLMRDPHKTGYYGFGANTKYTVDAKDRLKEVTFEKLQTG